jgi:hypothetical protein
MKFRIEHDDSFETWVGYAASIRDADDGGYATFRLYDSIDIDKVRSILKESHTGLSVNFGAIVPPEDRDGIVSHKQIHVEHCAATPMPAYAGAAITSMRNDAQELFVPHTPHLDSVKALLDEIRKAPV